MKISLKISTLLILTSLAAHSGEDGPINSIQYQKEWKECFQESLDFSQERLDKYVPTLSLRQVDSYSKKMIEENYLLDLSYSQRGCYEDDLLRDKQDCLLSGPKYDVSEYRILGATDAIEYKIVNGKNIYDKKTPHEAMCASHFLKAYNDAKVLNKNFLEKFNLDFSLLDI
jgi:hypothetical protein